MEVPSLEQSVQLSQTSTDSTLTFDTISKKRWLDTQYLLDNDFLAHAPSDLRSALLARRDRDYDYLKPLTRLRNQVYISQKTLIKQLQQMQSRARHESPSARQGRSPLDMMDDEPNQEIDVVNQGLMKDNLMVQQKQ